MRYRLGYVAHLLILLTLFSLVIPVLAQEELTETYTFDSGATFQFPETWQVDENSDPLMLVSEQTEMVMVDYAGLQAIGVDVNEVSQDDIMEMYFNEYHPDHAFKASKIEPFKIDDLSGVYYEYNAEDGLGRVVVISFSNGSMAVAEARSLVGKFREEETMLAIVQSFDNAEEITGTTAVVTQSVASCTVSTENADTVRVRVGPGENRTSIIFLRVGTSFEVLGKAVANDSSLWWKLDKEKVAPDKAVNEVWVKQDEVTPDGNCEDVLDVNAPPIVPIVNVSPPSTTSSGGGSNASSAGGNVPQAGSWLMSFSNGKASCFGTNTIDVPNNFPSQTIFVSISGGTMNLGGDTLTRIEGSTYQGIGQVTVNGENMSTNITVQVASATQIVGSIVGTINFGDTSCSVTYPFSVNKQ